MSQPINYSDTTPAAGAGKKNVKWQADAPTPSATRNVSAYLPDFTGDTGSGGADGLVPAPAAGDAIAGKFLKADATWAIPSGGGGGTGKIVPILPLQKLTPSGSVSWGTGSFPSGLTLYMRISGRKIMNGCSQFRIAFPLNNGTVVVSNAIIRKTDLEGTVWTGLATQITWGGSNTPTFTVVGENNSDFITYDIDAESDYYIIMDINVGSTTGSGSFATFDPLVAMGNGFKSTGATNDTTAATNAANFTGGGQGFFCRLVGK